MVNSALVSGITASLRPPTEVVIARWVWFAGSAIAAVSALITMMLVPDPLVMALVGGIRASRSRWRSRLR